METYGSEKPGWHFHCCKWSLQKSCRTTQNAKSTIGQDWLNFHKHTTMSLRSLRSLRSLTVSGLPCSVHSSQHWFWPICLGDSDLIQSDPCLEAPNRITELQELKARCIWLQIRGYSQFPDRIDINEIQQIPYKYHIFMHYVYLIYVNREPKGCKRRISRFRLLEVEQRWAYASKKFCTTVAHQRILQTSHFPSYAQSGIVNSPNGALHGSVIAREKDLEFFLLRASQSWYMVFYIHAHSMHSWFPIFIFAKHENKKTVFSHPFRSRKLSV